MTEPKSKPKTTPTAKKSTGGSKKPTGGAKTTATPKPKVTPEQVENARKTTAKASTSKHKYKTDGFKKEFLKMGVSEFVVGTEDYRSVVGEYNATHGTNYLLNHVPPFVFRNMLDHLNRTYPGK